MTNLTTENVIYEDQQVKITNLRAIIGTKTYAMSNITSVDLGRDIPDNTFPIILGVLGALIGIASIILIFGDNQIMCIWIMLFIGLIMIAFGIIKIFTSKPTFLVRIGSASGETNILTSKNEAYIKRIVAAMNNAIIQRG